MSKQKININEAGAISTSIAEKAFEHLINPIDERIQTTLRDAYDQITKGWSSSTISGMIEHCLISETDRLDMEVSDGKHSIRMSLIDESLLQSRSNWDSNFYINDPDLHDKLVELHRERGQLAQKRTALQTEIALQIIGRNTKQVLEAWPEAKSFIDEQFPEKKPEAKPSMDAPLDALLARFLPALPAPQSEGV